MLVDALLAALVACTLMTAVSLLRLRSALDALHALSFLGAASGVLLTIAVVAADGIATASFKGVLLLAILLGGGAVGVHAIGRALTLAGDWDVER